MRRDIYDESWEFRLLAEDVVVARRDDRWKVFVYPNTHRIGNSPPGEDMVLYDEVLATARELMGQKTEVPPRELGKETESPLRELLREIEERAGSWRLILEGAGVAVLSAEPKDSGSWWCHVERSGGDYSINMDGNEVTMRSKRSKELMDEFWERISIAAEDSRIQTLLNKR
jgi:hypothetical protein